MTRHGGGTAPHAAAAGATPPPIGWPREPVAPRSAAAAPGAFATNNFKFLFMILVMTVAAVESARSTRPYFA